MITNVLTAIGGVGVYGVISICLFFVVFSGALIWALSQKKSFLTAMGDLPLSDEGVITTTKGEQNHE